MNIEFLPQVSTLSMLKTSKKQDYTLPSNGLYKDEFVKSENISFKGLTRSLNGKIFLKEDPIIHLINKYPYAKGLFGKLIPEWVEKIPKENRGNNIRKFYKDFGKIVSNLRENGQTDENIEIASKKINDLFHEVEILTKGQEINIKQLGAGVFGTGYLFEENFTKEKPNKYVLKIFHDIKSGNKDHGNYIESNRGAFWLKNAGGSTQRTRVYTGDMGNGYLILQYADEHTPQPKKNVLLKKFGLISYDETSRDNGKNRINGFSYDNGGIYAYNLMLANNAAARRIYEKINKVPDKVSKWLELYNSKADKNSVYGLIEALELLPNQYKVTAFTKLTKYTDNSLKKALISKLYLLHKNEVTNCFDLFINDKTISVRRSLASNLNLLSKKDASKYFKMLSYNADNSIKKVLISKFNLLQTEEISYYFNKFSNTNDKSLIKALIKKLNLLPQDEVSFYFNKFSNLGDNSFDIIWANKIDLLQRQEASSYSQKLAINTDGAVKQVLDNKLKLLYYQQNIKAEA